MILENNYSILWPKNVLIDTVFSSFVADFNLVFWYFLWLFLQIRIYIRLTWNKMWQCKNVLSFYLFYTLFFLFIMLILIASKSNHHKIICWSIYIQYIYICHLKYIQSVWHFSLLERLLLHWEKSPDWESSLGSQPLDRSTHKPFWFHNVLYLNYIFFWCKLL